jgi:hypothetical protein
MIAATLGLLLVIVFVDVVSLRLEYQWADKAEQVDLSSGRLRSRWRLLGIEVVGSERDSFVSGCLDGERIADEPHWVNLNRSYGLLLGPGGHSRWSGHWDMGSADLEDWSSAFTPDARKEVARRFLYSMQANDGYPNWEFREVLRVQVTDNRRRPVRVGDLPQPDAKLPIRE